MRIVGDSSRPKPLDPYAVFTRLGHPRLLVLGDLILDRYTFGNADRVSQEAPVITLFAEQDEERLGGAANVCQMVRGLESEVICAGIVGDDPAGRAVRAQLLERGIETDLVLTDATRPTTTKHRFIGRAANRHPHQILRVDREVREPLREIDESRLQEAITGVLRRVDGVLISDYGKGVCTPHLLQAVIRECRRASIPVLVDPFRTHDYARYRGATAITPNRAEAEGATGMKIRDPADAISLGQSLCRDCGFETSYVTLDRDGMAVVHADGGEVFPTRPRDVYDITGAGDMVLSMLGICLAAGIAPEEAALLGNVAGGLEVEHVGVAVLSRAEIADDILRGRGRPRTKLIGADEFAKRAERIRSRGETIVFTNGCFDLLHVGHVTYLSQAAALGDHLVVAINSDASVSKIKGPARPVIRERDRAAMLEALECVDHVIIFEEDTPRDLLRAIRPDVLVKGGTYTKDQVVGHEIVEAYGGRVIVAGIVDGVSTSRIVESVQRRATHERDGVEGRKDQAA